MVKTEVAKYLEIITIGEDKKERKRTYEIDRWEVDLSELRKERADGEEKANDKEAF